MNHRTNQKLSFAYFLGPCAVLTLLFSTLFLSIYTSRAYANGNVYHVDQSASGTQSGEDWANAFLTVQQALDVAVSGDEIWVAEGVYLPTERTDSGDARSVTFVLIEGVGLYGGFPSGGTDFANRDWEANKTILSGDIDDDDIKTAGVTESYADIAGSNAYHVIQGSITVSYTLATVVDGFVVTGGSTASGSGGDAGGRESTGAGLNFRNDASVTLRNLHVIGNKSLNDGGGIHFFFDSDPVLENVTVENTRANDFGGGIFFHSNNNPTFSNVKIIGTSGGSAAGVYLHENNVANFGNFYVCRNTRQPQNQKTNAGSGLSIANNNTVKIMNAAFAANVSGERGGALRIQGDNVVDLDNVTMSGNHASSGGGIYIKDPGNTINIRNSIIWGNSTEIEVGTSGGGSLNVSYSLISTDTVPYAGTGNVASTTSPFIQDPNDGADNVWGEPQNGISDDNCGDLMLQPSAVTVDSGSNGAVPADIVDVNSNGNTAETLPIDLDGKARIYNTTVDMGAYEISVSLTPQTITFDLPASAQDGMMVDESVELSATASSNLDVTLMVQTADICSIDGNSVTMNQGGTCTIVASQPGDGTYAPAANVERNISVSKLDQTLSFSSPMDGGNYVIDEVVNLVATASSNLDVSFSSLAPSVCTVSANSATMLNAGTCIVQAMQPGDGRYNEAATQSLSLTVSKKTQAINFVSPADDLTALIGDNFDVFANSNSGLSVQFSVTTPSVCSINGNVVTMDDTGSCQIKASQPGNNEYEPAVDVFKSIVVGNPSLQSQTIELSAPANSSSLIVGGTLNLVATASSGLPVSFINKTPSVCTISGNVVSAIATGACQITARQSGNSQYNAANDVVLTITITEPSTISVFIPLVQR